MQTLQYVLDLNDSDFALLEPQIGPNSLDGDFPEIWRDRRWHPLTRQEIYLLIWFSKQLGFTLPRLVLERIAFWIQLIELCKDYRQGKLLLQMPYFNWPNRPNLSHVWNAPSRWSYSNEHGWFENGKIRLQFLISDFKDSERFNEKNFQSFIATESASYGWINRLPKEITTLERYLARKDRYRIVLSNRQELDEFVKNKCTTS